MCVIAACAFAVSPTTCSLAPSSPLRRTPALYLYSVLRGLVLGLGAAAETLTFGHRAAGGSGPRLTGPGGHGSQELGAPIFPRAALNHTYRVSVCRDSNIGVLTKKYRKA